MRTSLRIGIVSDLKPARLSARSIVATLTFMATGIATVFVARHLG